MSTAAIVMMVLTMSIVTYFTVYFFIKVLRTPPRTEGDPDQS